MTANSLDLLQQYNSADSPQRKGDFFEPLVLQALERRYRRKFTREFSVGTGTYLDGIAVGNGCNPIIAEIKHRNALHSLAGGNTSQQLPLQIEFALSNRGLYEIVVRPDTHLGATLLEQLFGLTRQTMLGWKISRFNPASWTFQVIHESGGSLGRTKIRSG